MKFCKICGNIMDDDGDVCSQCRESEESNVANRKISVVDSNRSSIADRLRDMINFNDPENRLSVIFIVCIVVTVFLMYADYFRLSYKGNTAYLTLEDVVSELDMGIMYFGTIVVLIVSLITCIVAWIMKKRIFHIIRNVSFVVNIIMTILCFLVHWIAVRGKIFSSKVSVMGTIYAILTIIIPITLDVLQRLYGNPHDNYDRKVIENAFFLYKSGADTEKIGQAIGVRGELLKKVIEICETCSPEYDIDRGIKLWKNIDK